MLSLGVGLVALVAMLLSPRGLGRISRTAYAQRSTALSLGGLTLLTALGLSSLWSISLIILLPILLTPVLALMWLVLLAAMVLGISAVAQPFGVALARRLGLADAIPPLSMMLGASVLTFGVLAFRLVPGFSFISVLLLLVLGAWGLGAVLLTRGGTRNVAAYA